MEEAEARVTDFKEKREQNKGVFKPTPPLKSCQFVCLRAFNERPYEKQEDKKSRSVLMVGRVFHCRALTKPDKYAILLHGTPRKGQNP